MSFSFAFLFPRYMLVPVLLLEDSEPIAFLQMCFV